ncbi:MAG: phosphate acyltransferase [Pseudomonadota bacterium]|nr:phosphate acyltransferase [Pseudomonadota bacterium]
MINSFSDILDAAGRNGPRRLAIPAPTAADASLAAAAVAAGLAVPCFVGDAGVIAGLTAATTLREGAYELWEEKDPRRVLGRALIAVRSGAADILLQGGVSAPDFAACLQDREEGLGLKGATVSYVSLYQLRKREKLILITDTFLNNRPTLTEKQQILANALGLARLLGIDTPKAAVLAAIEQVNPGIPSTLDAAILAKMGERRQFGKAMVEGPLDIDCALSREAAGRKGVHSPVTGNVDVYLVPEIDTGHLLAEALVFFGGMRTVGAVLGTARPALLNLPFVTHDNRLTEIALASLIAGKGGGNG